MIDFLFGVGAGILMTLLIVQPVWDFYMSWRAHRRRVIARKRFTSADTVMMPSRDSDKCVVVNLSRLDPKPDHVKAQNQQNTR